MSGVVNFSSGEVWSVNQWGWRALWSKALEDASSDEERAEWRTSLASHGLSFDLIETKARGRVALALLSSVEELEEHYKDHPDDYERGYAEDLRRLADLLRDEAAIDYRETEGDTR